MISSVLAQKIGRNLEDYGWLRTAWKALGYLFSGVYFSCVYRIYAIDLDAARSPAEPHGNQFTFRALGPDEDRLIKQIEDCQEWLKGRLKNRIAAGGVCLAALRGDQLAGFNLIGFGEVFVPLLNCKCAFRPSEAWSEHIAVMKDFRQRGLASQLRYQIFAELRQRGIRRLYGGTLITNTASLNLARKVGFKEIADVHYRKVFAKETWEYKRVRS